MTFDDWYKRTRDAVHEYNLDIGHTAYRVFTQFRHLSKVDRDKVLVWFRRDFPKLYSLLMEVQMFDEQYGDRSLLDSDKHKVGTDSQ